MMGIWIEDEDYVYTISDLYAEAQDNSEPLLSSYSGTWWAAYITNHDHFDRLFKRKYASYFPYDQEYTDGVDSVLDEFQADVYALLLANDKKYSELYRVNVIDDDDAYSLTNNVSVTETTTRTVDTDNTFTKGEETVTDDGTNEYGVQLVEVDGTESPSEQTITQTNTTAPYNSDGWENTDQIETVNGSRTDTTNMDTTYGAHTDNIDNTRTLSERTDTNNTDLAENISFSRVGNIGVQTVDSMLEGHINAWTNPLFNFYEVVFSDIARELLRGC